MLVLFYIYENWKAFTQLVSIHFSKDTKESFGNVIASNGFVPANQADYSENVIVPPFQRANINKLSNPTLARLDAMRYKAMDEYNKAIAEFNGKLDELKTSGDITLDGILVINGSIFPRYKLVMAELRTKKFFVKSARNMISDEPSPELDKYLFLFENLKLSGSATDEEILAMKEKIVKGENLPIFEFLLKDGLNTMSPDEQKFLYDCMIDMKYLTPNGLKVVQSLTIPDASSIIGIEPEVSSQLAEISAEDQLILKSKSVYTSMDISDVIVSPDFDNSLDSYYAGREYLPIDWKCQRDWFECHSHLPDYGLEYYYPSNPESEMENYESSYLGKGDRINRIK
jgi:hypothetical protein